MTSYIIRRILQIIPLIILVSFISFFIVNLAPGDPASIMLGPDAGTEQLEIVRERMGLHEPLPIRFANWFLGVLRGDLGESFFYEPSVSLIIRSRVPITGQIAFGGLLFLLFIGIPLGIISARLWGKITDDLIRIIAFVGLSIPSFWLGLNFIYLFAVRLGWLPSGGFVRIQDSFLGSIKTTILPAASLGLIRAAGILRLLRSSMLEVLNLDYIRTARSKGLTERIVLYKHALRNAVLPTITDIGTAFGLMLGGSIIIEEVFAISGLGRVLLTAVSRRDYPLIQGIILFYALVYLIVNLLVDIAYAYIDPRISYD